jgi:hypothetical protein
MTPWILYVFITLSGGGYQSGYHRYPTLAACQKAKITEDKELKKLFKTFGTGCLQASGE